MAKSDIAELSAKLITVIPRVSNGTMTNLINKVTVSTTEAGQVKILDSNIASVSESTSSGLVNSPVSECGYLNDCLNKPIGSRVNLQINKIYGIKK